MKMNRRNKLIAAVTEAINTIHTNEYYKNFDEHGPENSSDIAICKAEQACMVLLTLAAKYKG